MLSRLAELHSEKEIKQHIQQVLNTFGDVESIHIFEPTKENPQSIALATMADVAQASQVSSSLGLRAFGHKSLIIPLLPPKT
ncbi:MAG: RNA-binding protein [Gammaproteobacteria bacterium]|nr:RNA-binding protein [Gammaproteobacteria bacterium]MBU1447031.1 RNA-binding protein [Gammaproteobacteria bacterium]MDD2928801.1 hypothetical protein [Sideroxydans sp.]MDD5470601.1 hypothetical protein [Sideroxydans sp.]